VLSSITFLDLGIFYVKRENFYIGTKGIVLKEGILVKRDNLGKNLVLLIALVLLGGFVSLLSRGDFDFLSGEVVSFGDSCQPDHIVYRLMNNQNGHAELWNKTTQGYINVCLESDKGHTCIDAHSDGNNDNVIFRIGAETNAHVEKKNFTTPGYQDVCFGRLACTYKNICSGNEECLGSLLKENNSHIAECNVYEKKICCATGCHLQHAFWSTDGSNKISSAHEGDVVLLVINVDVGCAEVQEQVTLRIYTSEGNKVFETQSSFTHQGIIESYWVTPSHSSSRAVEYYFEATLFGTSLRSESPDLEIFPKDIIINKCGDGVITDKEICDSGALPDHSDDIFVGGIHDCGVQSGWSGGISCDQCVHINTSLCHGLSGSCGDGIMNPGELCDGSAYFANIDRCSDISSRLEGSLPCNNCRYDVTQCKRESAPEQECSSCSQCDDLSSIGDCKQNICVSGCGGYGSCYYDPGIGEDCKSCREVTSCDDYTNELDCEVDRCILMGDHPCEWMNDECQESIDCEWDCDNIYTTCVNEVSSKVGMCRLVSGECNELLDNPTNNYPEQIVCGERVQDFAEFPVFTWMNIIVSVFLLIGYYVILRKRF